MREITHEELKQIQLGILDKVHDFCEKNGITYFLSSGTLIGAVRHKGYIPWDDDLDIYMPRPDYNKFIKLYSQNPSENTEVLSLETSKTYQYPFAKVIDTRTEMIEMSVGDRFKIGVYMDVFPLESVPDNRVRFFFYLWVLTLIRKLSLYCVFAQSKKIKSFSGGIFSYRKVIKFLFYPFFLIFPWRKILEIYDVFARRYDANSIYVYNMSCGIGYRGRFPRRVINESVDIVFERKIYKTMGGYEEYLRVTYGDFMQLPPEEKRISNHLFKAYWKI